MNTTSSLPCGLPKRAHLELIKVVVVRAEYSRTFMAVAKAYLEGSDVEASPSSGAVRLTVKLPPGTIDAEGPRTPQARLAVMHGSLHARCGRAA